MKKKLLCMFMATAMTVSLLAGCGGGSSADSGSTPAAAADDASSGDTAASGGGKVGVAMPTKDLQRWNQDGDNMKSELEAAGYEVDLQYAANDIATQVSQIENMINSGCQLLSFFIQL